MTIIDNIIVLNFKNHDISVLSNRIYISNANASFCDNSISIFAGLRNQIIKIKNGSYPR